jgi:hypothetical protein
MPTAYPAFVVGKEHHGHHDRGDDSHNYRDAHEEKQWRCCALTFLDDVFETLYLGDRMVHESTRLFPDLLQKEIRALPVIRRRIHSHRARATARSYIPVAGRLLASSHGRHFPLISYFPELNPANTVEVVFASRSFGGMDSAGQTRRLEGRPARR